MEKVLMIIIEKLPTLTLVSLTLLLVVMRMKRSAIWFPLPPDDEWDETEICDGSQICELMQENADDGSNPDI